MGDGGHLGRGDAAAAVQGGEYFTEGNHFAANTGLLFYQYNLVALICEIQGSLHPGNAAAYDKSIDLDFSQGYISSVLFIGVKLNVVFI